jgi:hypothetical protein
MVRVYFNLHKKVYSVQKYVKGKGWRLSHHTNEVYLTNVSFKVYENGRQKVLKEKQKNVHAFVLGELSESVGEYTHNVTYNPYLYDSFVVRDTKQKLFICNHVKLTENRNIQIIF